MSLRGELRRRFEQTLRAELEAPGGRELPEGWPPPRLPPALRESVVAAAALNGGECPATLSEDYTEKILREPLVEPAHGQGPLPAGEEASWTSFR